MKLHLPLFLRKSVLSCLAFVAGYTLSSGTLAFADDLVLGTGEEFSIDYADSASIPNLENGTLQLEGDTLLQLLNCGSGDGKTYTLATGVTGLVDAEGNPISLDSSNNAISNYFDTTQPGTGFWTNGSLVLNDGTLQLVLHDQDVKEAVTITTRQTGNVNYQYYAGVLFKEISSSANGGAIYGDSSSTITLSNKGSVTFRGNTASGSYSTYAYGGAIYGNSSSPITLSNNGSVILEKNTVSKSNSGSYSYSTTTVTATAKAYGGAIAVEGGIVELCSNNNVVFKENTASSSASATYSYSAATALANASVYGGAVYGAGNSSIIFRNNGNVTFAGNSVFSSSFSSSNYDQYCTVDDSYSYAYGGAICGGESSQITLSSNESVIFDKNIASSSSSSNDYADTLAYAKGGAIYGARYSTITLSNNGSVVFEGNKASSISSSDDRYSQTSAYAEGGAIYGDSSSTITLSNNGSVVFEGNTASASYRAYGGAIYAATIALSDNGSVVFEGNTASGSSYAYGGAIYANSNLSIQNNDSVLFEKNAEISNGTYRLRSIYAGGSGDVISLSAAAGKSITFRDSIYIGSGSTFKINEAYEGLPQQGDIIFTGATTVDDLYAVKGNIAGTSSEIINSRTTEVNAMTNLYGGRLRVEDGAIYKGYGITVHEDSAATVRVKDAELIHTGYDLTFNAGTTLELEGNNVISGNVQMQAGSILFFDGSKEKGLTILTGSLSLGQGVSYALDSEASWSGDNLILMQVDGTLSDTANQNEIPWGSSAFTWLDNVLIWNYNAETLDAYFLGDYLLTPYHTRRANYTHYQTFVAKDLTSSASGGAIYGDSYSTIALSDNGSVTFEGNTASGSSSAYGGAISGGTITLSNNESVVFEGNMVSGSHAYGGAISGSTITLNENESVVFEGNTSSSGVEAHGGAIYGSTITLNENGNVVFEGNTAGSSYSIGGAISSNYGTISLSHNDSVMFNGNSASLTGGAISGSHDVSLNGNGRVSFIGNSVTGYISSDGSYAYGGAIYMPNGPVSLCDNGRVEFIGNMVSVSSASSPAYIYGGAICAFNDLNIRNNDSVEFYQNAEVTNGVYRLNSIVVGGSWSTVSLSAAEGKQITFRDSIYIDAGNTFNLNADYTNANGETIKQQGDIIFTGATTVDDLYAVKGNIAGTEEEVLASRTSEVYSMTNLYGGRLRVEDGAIYQGYGITAHAGSASTVRVKDAELRHDGYSLTFNAGTTLELEGGNSISGNVQMLDDSTLRFIYAADTTLSLTGNLNFDGSVTIELVGYGEGNYELISQNGGTLSGLDMEALRFMNGQGESLDAARFAWVDKSLYYFGSVENLIWTNGAGDGLWNNTSQNWASDGISYALTVLQNVILGAGGNETITMVGNQAVNTLTVQQGGQYTLAGDTAGTKLTVTGDVLLEENASLSIQGNLKSGALKGAGSLSVSGTLTLTDATASSSIGGDVSVNGALKTAGVLTVGGALKAGSLAGGGNELAVSGNITLGSMSGDDNVLTSGGSVTTGAINGSHNSITAVTLVTTNGKALTGDYNTLEATAGQVFVQGELKGNYNTLKGGKAPADGNTISVWSGINGNNNVLQAEEGNVVTHAINGSHNSITAAALVTTNRKELTGDYNTLESTAGQVYVQGLLTGSYNTLKASAAPSASDPNALCVWGGIVGDYNQLLTTGGNIAMTSSNNAKVQGNHNTLEATEGAILVRDILGAENTLTAGTYISASAVGADGAGSNGNTLTAGTYVNINGKLTGDSNDISSSGTDSNTENGIRIATGLEGDGNTLTAENGRIVIGGGTSLNGSNNTLLAKGATTGGEGITLDGKMSGSGNKLTAETGNIKLGNITGDSNTLEAEAGTITTSAVNGTGNTLTGATVNVNGELKGSANTIEGNSVHVGTLTGTGHAITALAGNVSIGSLNDTAMNSISAGASYGISVGSGSASNQTWIAGSLSVTGAAGLSLTDSTVTIGGTVESTVLTLAGDTSLTAGLVSAGNISMTTGVSIVGNVNAADSIVMSGGAISGALTAGNATMMNAVTLGSANVANLQLQVGASLDVTGVLNAGTVSMQQLTTSAPALTVGQFAAGETVFQLSAETLNALNLEHGESVVIARANQSINRDFAASLTSSGSTMLDVAAYRYMISVSGTDVVVTLDYANWGTRVWYGNTWEGLESWQDYMVCGYDAVDGVETVDLKGAEYAGSLLLVAPGDGASSTVFRNGSLSFESGLIADGRVEIASTAALEVYDYLDAAGKEVSLLQGAMMLNNADIGSLTGTGGALTIYEAGEVSIGSNVTLGSLRNDGTLDIGKNKLDVAANVTNGGNVVAGEVVVHSKATIAAKFNALVADKVTVTNTLSSYADAISLGDGSAVGELYADNLTVREGTVKLGYADKATAQKLEKLELQKNATLHLNAQTELSVSNSLTAAANSAVQLEQDAALKYQEVSISNRNEDKTVSVNAAQLAAGSAELVLQDAYVTSTSGSSRELAYALVNSTVENAGSGTLQLTNAGNELSGVVASSGNVEIYNAASGMTLDELRMAAGLSLSAAVGDAGTTHTPAGNAEVSVSGSALLAGSSILNANLTLEAGSTLDMVSLDAGAVALNGTLTFGGKISIGENLLALLNEKLGWESSVTLFTGLERVDMSAVTGNSDGGLVWAGDVFSNMGDNRHFQISYVAEVGSLVVAIVPEPATSTLSLLALAALAARRRRK